MTLLFVRSCCHDPYCLTWPQLGKEAREEEWIKLPKVLHVGFPCRSNSSLDSGVLKSRRTALVAELRAEVMSLGCRRGHSPCGISRASHNIVVIKKSAAGEVSWELGTSKYEKRGRNRRVKFGSRGHPVAGGQCTHLYGLRAPCSL